MKLHLPHGLFRAVMACFAALVSSSLASASMAPGAAVSFSAPDVEQTGSMLCWAASAADVLAAETGQDAATIYRSLTAASGNTPGFVETALSWYSAGAAGELTPQAFDGSHTVSRQGFETPGALAATLQEAFTRARAVSLMLYARGEEQGTGHAVTVYASEQEGGRLFLSYADSADGVQGLRRAEVLAAEGELVLAGTPYAVGALTYLGEDATADVAPAAPVGAYMHSSPSIQVYTDLAENRGVYRFAYSPSLITYRNGEADYTVAYTPDYSVVADMGCYTLVGNGSCQLTVNHNGIMVNATFNSRYVGSYAQKYSGVGVHYNSTFEFGTSNPNVPMNEDYKVERLSRLVTDSYSASYCTDTSVLANLSSQTIYRVGGGNSGYYDTSGNINWLSSAWGAGLTAGILQLAASWGSGVYMSQYNMSGYDACTSENPLPSVGQPGDSGSPLFIYNESTMRFEYVGSLWGATSDMWIASYNPSATTAVMDFCTVGVATAVDSDGSDASIYYVSGAHVRSGDKLVQDGSAATYLRQGIINLGGQEVARFNGVALDEFSEGTWKLLDADSLTWYTYTDADYINAQPNSATGVDEFGSDDLFYTSNLHFTADSADGSAAAYRRIELTENVDLGIGHVQFSLGDGTTSAVYDIGQSSSELFLSSAGYVVDEGVTVNNYFTYEKGRELRRVGAGTMNMVGTGNNDVLLNIGGGGVTYLNRADGYAAYSALVNNEAVLRLADAGQVYNNVTLGANGGVLDFNGNDYRWASGGAHATGADGKEYFGLTVYEGINRVETSTLANYASGTTATITIERTDDFEFAGAFRDGSTYTGSGSVEMDSRYTMMPSVLVGLYNQFSEADRVASDSTLKVIYNGGATMEMTGVYTVLTGDSGLEVASGTVHLHGTNTIHALGSESGTNTNRYQNANDWHYAMAETGVKVGSGASFVLGDHALLIGDVQVESGGSYVMKQAVNERYEYVEGWYYAEDTYALADYYGHKGNVSLAAGAAMEIQFDEGVATQVVYSGDISGEGSVTVDAGKGSVKLTGNNTVSGEKTVESGNVRVAEGAQGDTSEHKWVVKEEGSIALEGVATKSVLQTILDEVSEGVLALVESFQEQLSDAYAKLIVGAADGAVAHYGTSSQSLQAQSWQWVLGGGGGTLMVDFALEGDNKLVLGNKYGTGMVVLTNANNSFNGGIDFAGGVALGYTSAEALGSNVVSIGYGQQVAAVEGAEFASSKIDTASSGVFAISNGSASYDFSSHGNLSLGSYGSTTLSGGSFTVADGAPYRLGGAGELTIATALSGNHGMVIDGQGTTGSRVIFASASADTGAVVVQGYDSTQASAGEVTVSFTADNALAAASSVTLRNNAGMDLNGTNQQLNNLAGDASSLIFDDKGGNTLTLHNSEDSASAVRVQALGTDVVKTGSGTLELSGTNVWKSLTINEGAVQVSDSKSLGYLSSGSQEIAVSVNAGATLHITQDATLTNTLNVAGYGADGASCALVVDGQLSAGSGSFNVTADAAISGKFSFNQLNLRGNTLTVGGSGSSISASSLTDGTLRLTSGASMNLASYQTGSGLSFELDNATLYVDNGTINGSLTVGSGGATIENTWNGATGESFTQAGFVSGSSADSTLKLVAYKHSINFTGGVDFAGKLEVGNGVTVNITADASIGALTREGSSGDAASLVVSAATLELTGAGSNFSNASLSLTNGSTLRLTGLESGVSMGSLSSLNLGSDGVLSLASLAGYTSNAMMSIATIEGTRSLEIDMTSLAALKDGSTYHLLSSTNELSGWTLLNDTSNSRLGLELVAGGSAGDYTLDLKVTGQAAHAEWQGTGTLVAGTANAANITSSAGDSTFMSMDSLSIAMGSSDSSNTLTLGGDIQASAVTISGEGSLTLAQENSGKFTEGTHVVLNAEGGTLSLGSSTAIAGTLELKAGTLTADSDKSTTALNAIRHISVTGDAGLVLTSDSAVTTGIQIDGKLTVDAQQSSNGRTLKGNLSGDGELVKINSGKLNLVGDHSAFSGSIDVQAGTLQLGSYESGTLDAFSINASSINMGSGTTLVLKSSTMELGADVTWGNGSTLYVQEGSGDGPSATSVGYTFSGKQTLAGTLNYQSQWGKVTHFSGDIVDAEGASGALNFTSNGNGGGNPAVVLTGNNTYSGGTTLNFNSLTLYVGSEQALGTGGLKLNAGTLAWYGVGGDWNGDLTASGIEVSGGTMNSNGYNVTYSGKVSGSSGTLTKSGAGTLELSNFTYSGTTHVAEGTLALGIGSTSWRTGFSGESGTTLRLNCTTAYGTYLFGSVSGGVSLQLSGDFAMVAANTHTGGTELLNGSLDIGHVNALQSGALYAHEGTTVTVQVEQALMAGHSVVDHLAFADGASVVVGTDSMAGSLSFNSLSGTASFLLDIFSADSYDRLTGDLGSGSQLGVSMQGNEIGSYMLVAGNVSGLDTTDISLSGTSDAYSYVWSTTDAGLTLNVDYAAGTVNLWTGGTDGTWDAEASTWNGYAFNSEQKTVVRATEDTSIRVASEVSTTSLDTVVAEGTTLSISSGGASIVADSLLKEGTGTLRFEEGSANSFAAVVVNEGTLSVSSESALGTTNISGSGTFELTGGSMEARLHDTLTVENIRITNGAQLTYTSEIWEWGGIATGRHIEIEGSGSLLSMTKWSNLNASSIVLRNGGTIRTGANGLGNDGGTIYVEGSGTIQSGNEGAAEIYSSISGKGTLTIADWNGTDQTDLNGSITDAADGKLALEFNHNNVHINAENSYSGGTTILGGSVTTATENALGTGGVTINGGTLKLGSSLAIGSLSGTGGSIDGGANDLHIEQAKMGSYAGNIVNVGTLTKDGVGALSLSGTNSIDAINLEKGKLEAASDGAFGDASITITAGAVLYVANGATVTNALSGGSYTVGADASQSGTFSGAAATELLSAGFTKDGAGTVTVVNGTGSTPAGAMAINAGTLAYDAGSSTTLGAVSGSATFALVGGTVNLGSTEQFTVSKVAVSTATLNLNGVTDFGTRQLTVGEGGTVTAYADRTLDSNTLIVNGGTVQADSSMESSFFYVGSLSGTGGTVDANGKMLVINQSADGRYDGGFSGGDVTKRGDATLELGGKASLASLQIDSGTVKLASSTVFGDSGMTTSVLCMNGGVFDINGQTTGSGADSFMFDVASGYISFIGSGDMLVEDSSGTEGSGLGFNTANSDTAVSHGGTGRAEIAANIVSGGNGAAGDKIVFNVKSTGDLVLSGDIGADQAVAEHHQFGIAKNGSGTMILSGNNGFSGGTNVNAGTLVAASKTALGNGDVAVASGATLEVAEGGQLSLKGTLKLDEVVTVTQKDTGSAATLGSMQMGSSGASAYIHGKVEGGLATLDNAVIDIAKGATLEMKDVLLTQNSRITDDPATLSVDNVTVVVGKANAAVSGVTTLVAGTELVAAGAGNTSFALTEDSHVVNLFCSALDTVDVTGSSLTLDLSAYVSDIQENWLSCDYIALSFGAGDDSLAHFDATVLSITASFDGKNFAPVYVDFSEASSAAVLYIANSVPEPTTATLSLLALSMLAARRRRK